MTSIPPTNHISTLRSLYAHSVVSTRLYNVHNVGTTSYERQNDVACVLGISRLLYSKNVTIFRNFPYFCLKNEQVKCQIK